MATNMWGIRAYYNFKALEELEYACNFLMQEIKLEEFNLKDFMNVNKIYQAVNENRDKNLQSTT